MTDEEIKREQEEAERLQSEINSTISLLNRINQENAEMELDLKQATSSLNVLISNCRKLNQTVSEQLSTVARNISNVDISTKHIFATLDELTTYYTAFKNISDASKRVTQYTDEYNTRFHYYNQLRQISIGYVVALDSHIISSEKVRKIVEEKYLQNTEYWLAYCISAVMLWASNEREAAQRAMNKGLKLNYFNSCLFYLLINLRFGRIEAAKKWYVKYLERADRTDLGDEWQYLLQAFLFGAFGSDSKFQEIVALNFQNMLDQVVKSTVDYAEKFTAKAIEFAELYAHKSEQRFTTLRRTCKEYSEMHSLLSTAEKNAEIGNYFEAIGEEEESESKDLPRRIEDVLYSLISNYDEDELKVVHKIRYYNSIINAQGDTSIAEANSNAIIAEQEKKKDLAELLLSWAFADGSSQVDVSVKRFSISLMKEAIIKGFEQFVESYRKNEQETYTFTIDDCILSCGDNNYLEMQAALDAHYEKNKFRNRLKDKYVLIYSGICSIALVLLLTLLTKFSPELLTAGILLGLSGILLLWRRLLDMRKILEEKKRQSKRLLKQALEDLSLWRKAYKEADAQSAEMLNAIAKL